MSYDPILSRRDFMRLSAAGLAGTTLGCAPRRPPPGEPVRRTLGRTGLSLPIVSMGSCYAVNLVQSALDEGIVYIQTSSGYGEQEHERRMGEVFRDRPRDSFLVGTSPDLPAVSRAEPVARWVLENTSIRPASSLRSRAASSAWDSSTSTSTICSPSRRARWPSTNPTSRPSSA